MKSEPPNKFRLRGEHLGRWQSTDADGMNGAFSVPLTGFGHKIIAHCISSNGTGDTLPEVSGWEHVSIHIQEYGKRRIPTWAEMCAVKQVFWNDDEWVVQYHPAKSDYVNNAADVLHLWKPPVEFPKPPIICV